MLCDICKSKEATVHLTEVINDEMTEMHLCEECAKTKGEDMAQHFSIADLLSEMVDFPQEAAMRKEHIRIKCPNCGMSYADFKKLGRFGCAHCYEVFKRALYPLFKKIHGTTHHMGKQPGKLAAKTSSVAEGKVEAKKPADELQDLRNRLTKAIEREAFEEAAMLRDRIKALEKDRNKTPGRR